MTPNFNGLCFHLRVADNIEFHSSPEAFGHMSPHCRFSDLGPFRLRIFSAQVGNRTCAHGDESNPLEISMSSAMKGEPGLATGLTTLGALLPFIRAWKSSHRGPIHFLLLYRGSSPFTHCATSAGPAPPVLVLRHQCRYCATSAGTAPPVPVSHAQKETQRTHIEEIFRHLLLLS